MGPNDLVVCVDARPGQWGFGDALTKGRVYTVSRIHPDGDALQICEVSIRGWFYAYRFRPVNESRLSVFRSMLVNPRKRIEVEA